MFGPAGGARLGSRLEESKLPGPPSHSSSEAWGGRLPFLPEAGGQPQCLGQRGPGLRTALRRAQSDPLLAYHLETESLPGLAPRPTLPGP